MKKVFAALFVVSLLFVSANCYSQTKGAYPSTPKEVALKFMQLYSAGDAAAAGYVEFSGIYITELAMTPERAEKEVFPEELAKQKKKAPVKITTVSERIDEQSEYGSPAAYVKLKVGNGETYLTLFRRDGNKWKVDITVLWANEWYDGQIY